MAPVLHTGFYPVKVWIDMDDLYSICKLMAYDLAYI